MPKATTKELSERMERLESAVSRIEELLAPADPAQRPIPKLSRNQTKQQLDELIDAGTIFRDGAGDIVIVHDDDNEEIPQPTPEQRAHFERKLRERRRQADVPAEDIVQDRAKRLDMEQEVASWPTRNARGPYR